MRFFIHTTPHDLHKPPLHVEIQVCVAEHTKDQEGNICLTPPCATRAEAEYWFNKLIKEMTQLKRKSFGKLERDS